MSWQKTFSGGLHEAAQEMPLWQIGILMPARMANQD